MTRHVHRLRKSSYGDIQAVLSGSRVVISSDAHDPLQNYRRSGKSPGSPLAVLVLPRDRRVVVKVTDVFVPCLALPNNSIRNPTG